MSLIGAIIRNRCERIVWLMVSTISKQGIPYFISLPCSTSRPYLGTLYYVVYLPSYGVLCTNKEARASQSKLTDNAPKSGQVASSSPIKRTNRDTPDGLIKILPCGKLGF